MCVSMYMGLLVSMGRVSCWGWWFGCYKIERKIKLLAPKLEDFQKHVDCQKTTIHDSCVVVGDYYY